jgi:hypothetical protein
MSERLQFSAASYAWTGGTADPSTMSARDINAELDRLDRESSKANQEMIAAGRGNEKWSETLTKSDPLAKRSIAIHDRLNKLRSEIAARYGPGAPSRLPTHERGRFGPRERGGA